jgi:hypothetical protein
MIEKLNITFLFICIFFSLFQTLYSQQSRFSPFSTRNAAIGGSHAALTDDFSTIFNNAAGFRGIESDFTVSEISVKATGPISTIVLGAQGGELTEIIGELGSSNIGLDLVGPLSIGKINNNMAWGIFNIVDTDIFIPNLTQDAEVTGRFDLGGVFGYSFGFDFIDSNSQLNFGFLSKLFFRTESNIEKTFTDIISALNDISSLISPDTIPVAMGFGFGIDLGMKYIWNDTFSVGIAVRDIYTPLFMFNYDSITTLSGGGDPQFEYSTLSADYSLGFMYSPHMTFFNGLLGNIKLMFDYNDIFDFALNSEYARNILLHLGFGIEFTIFDILALRMGLYEGLPAVGAGLDLHLFKFSFAMYGSELSTQPGLMSVYNLMLGIEFSY